jgi:ketosteroid isomerase-like protein
MSGAVTRYADAWRRSDIDEMLDCYHPDICVHYGGTSAFAGTHHGRDRLIDLLLETARRSNRQLLTIDQIDDHGTHGALFVTESITFDGSAITVRRALRYRVADDRIIECWLYDHDQHLVDRAWSGSPPGSQA